MKLFVIFELCFLAILHADEGEGFGIHRKNIRTEATDSVFTFRHGRLVHEVTTFVQIASDRNADWVEHFYDGKNVLFTRAGFIRDGKAILSVERYWGAQVAIIQGTRAAPGYPKRLSVGGESFDMADDGLYKIISDRNSLLKESSLMPLEFSTKELESIRKKHLHVE